MTCRIPKSAIAGIGDFSAQAAAHAIEMKNWRAHQARVRDDDAGGVTGIQRHWPLKRPAAHPLVEAAVNENDEMDFELVDDGPTPEHALRTAKDDLLRKVIHLEQEAVAALAPVGKRRMMNLRANLAVAEHVERLRKHDEAVIAEFNEHLRAHEDSGLIKSIASKIGLRKAPQMPVVERPTMPGEDAERVEAQTVLQRKIDAIGLIAAQAQHDIEDLTAETIGAWQVPEFKA